jgi:hypothetical protein
MGEVRDMNMVTKVGSVQHELLAQPGDASRAIRQMNQSMFSKMDIYMHETNSISSLKYFHETQGPASHKFGEVYPATVSE